MTEQKHVLGRGRNKAQESAAPESEDKTAGLSRRSFLASTGAGAAAAAVVAAAPAQQPHPSDINPRAPRSASRQETGRRERVPLGTPRSKLPAYHRDGYVGRYVNDVGGRIADAERAGYQFVTDDRDLDESGRGDKRRITVGTKEDGSPMVAYLMEIRREFYEEDQATKQSKNDEMDAAIKRGVPEGATPQDINSFYGRTTLS